MFNTWTSVFSQENEGELTSSILNKLFKCLFKLMYEGITLEKELRRK